MAIFEVNVFKSRAVKKGKLDDFDGYSFIEELGNLRTTEELKMIAMHLFREYSKVVKRKETPSEEEDNQVLIIFSPPSDIISNSKGEFLFCEPLTAEEKNLFLLHFRE
jgi:hypothetical protein